MHALMDYTFAGNTPLFDSRKLFIPQIQTKVSSIKVKEEVNKMLITGNNGERNVK